MLCGRTRLEALWRRLLPRLRRTQRRHSWDREQGPEEREKVEVLYLPEDTYISFPKHSCAHAEVHNILLFCSATLAALFGVARSRGVLPSASLQHPSAPKSSRRSTISAPPPRTAACKGLSCPHPVRTSAPTRANNQIWSNTKLMETATLCDLDVYQLEIFRSRSHCRGCRLPECSSRSTQDAAWAMQAEYSGVPATGSSKSTSAP